MTKTTAKSKTSKQNKKTNSDNHQHDHQHDQHQHDHSKESFIAANEKISLKLPWKKIELSYQKNLRQAAKSFKAEGFRKGKAPLALVEKQLGTEKIIESTLQDIVPGIYEEAVKKTEKKPITTPEFHPVSLNKGEDWEIEAFYASYPEVKIDSYQKAISKGKKTAEKFIQERQAAMKKEVEKNKTTEKKKDDQQVETRTELSKEEKNEIQLQQIFKELVEASKPKIPELLLRQETQAEFQRLQKQLEQYKISLEDYLKRRSIDMEILSNELASNVLGRLQVDFILASISQKEKLEISQKEIDEAFAKVADDKTREELKKNQSYQTQLKANLLQQKTLGFILSL